MFNKFIIISLAAIQLAKAELPAKFIRAIHQVETGGKTGKILGDKTKDGRFLALGSLQIHKKYWIDALKYDPSIGGKYEDCQKHDYSVKVMTAYLNRYGSRLIKNRDFASLSRLHNSGPGWKQKRHLTDTYTKRVLKYMQK